jgi:hypothetical protein
VSLCAYYLYYWPPPLLLRPDRLSQAVAETQPGGKKLNNKCIIFILQVLKYCMLMFLPMDNWIRTKLPTFKEETVTGTTLVSVPDPRSGGFLPAESGIETKIWFRRDEDPRTFFRELRNSFLG